MTQPQADAQQFQIGQWVRSAPVGSWPAFTGQITGYSKERYIVRDDQKRRFARTAGELEPLQ